MNMFIIMFVLGIRNGLGLIYEIDKVQSNYDKLRRQKLDKIHKSVHFYS